MITNNNNVVMIFRQTSVYFFSVPILDIASVVIYHHKGLKKNHKINLYQSPPPQDMTHFNIFMYGMGESCLQF